MDTSKDVVRQALAHRQPSRVPVDFGATTTTGIHCSVVAALRDHFGLEKRLVKIHEPFQMLGYVEEDLREAMGVDTVPAMPLANMFGVPVGDDWEEWRTWWGQTVLMSAGMALDRTPEGEYVAYPQGDRSAPPSARMPASGYFFDAIIRQGEFDEDDPDPKDNLEEFGLLGDDQLEAILRNARAAAAGGKAVVSGLPGTAIGDIACVPAIQLKCPKGIRDVAEWYMSVAARPEFVGEVFARQTDIALENLAKIHATVGDLYDAVFVCGTDFGTQISTFCSKESFLELYAPSYKRLNDWIHANTGWKTFKHSCGAIEPFIQPLIDCGFDILNPVQCSATGMEPEHLKKAYGDRIVFWGGGVDTQQVLPFGAPAQVREQVLERCRIFSPGGGFVFTAIHNVQALTPTENVVAMLDAVKEFNAAGR